jgi:hypothetical protein
LAEGSTDITAAAGTKPVTVTYQDKTAAFTVTVRPPEVTLTGGQGSLSQAANTAFTVTVAGVYSAFSWALNGEVVSGETSRSFTRYAGSLEVKRHTLTVYVTKGGFVYAKRVTFTVNP